jgi:4-hydroxybenzoate polyprenyltransferase
MLTGAAGVTLASMVINDYFDWRSGADVVNAPHKPLPSGIAKPDIAVLLAGAL